MDSKTESPLTASLPPVVTSVRGKEFPLERREMIRDKEKKVFHVLVVDTLNKLPEAEEYKGTFKLDIPGKGTMTLDTRAVSYGQWDQLETDFPLPTPDSERIQSMEYQAELEQQQARTRLLRRAYLIDICCNGIPGETISQKADWLSENIPEAQTVTLYNYLLNDASALTEEVPELVASYDSFKVSEVVKVGSMQDWGQMAKANCYFRSQRPNQDFILEYSVKQVTEFEKKRIELECRQPIAPSRPGRDSAGRPSQNHPIYDTDNEEYKRQLLAVELKKQVMMWEAALFPLPGVTIEEKYEKLSHCVLGDIITIQAFLRDKIFGNRGLTSFF